MIAVIRIKGQVGIRQRVKETLYRLRLRRKYACVVLAEPTAEQMGMIKSVKDFVAFGEISEETYKKLVEKRGKKDKDGGLKPFFRLHPPVGGFERLGIKKPYARGGSLGYRGKDMKKLVMKMI